MKLQWRFGPAVQPSLFDGSSLAQEQESFRQSMLSSLATGRTSCSAASTSSESNQASGPGGTECHLRSCLGNDSATLSNGSRSDNLPCCSASKLLGPVCPFAALPCAKAPDSSKGRISLATLDAAAFSGIMVSAKPNNHSRMRRRGRSLPFPKQ